MCSTWIAAPFSRAMRTRRCVHRSAVVTSRHTWCELGSPGTRRGLRSSRRNSSSEWKAARRVVFSRMAVTPGSSATSSEPVDEPMNTLMPAEPGRRSSSGTWRAFSCVPPTQKAKSQCMRCRPSRTFSASVSAVVVSGFVFGISNTEVTPPSTAPREPVSRSSLWVRPGSRKWTWLSMTPGSTCRPRQSIRWPADQRERSPIATIAPAVTATSRTPSPS